MDKSIDDIINEAMEKKRKMSGEQIPENKDDVRKTTLDNTADYLISDISKAESDNYSDGVSESEGSLSDKQGVKASDVHESKDSITISQDVFDSIISSRDKPNTENTETKSKKSTAPDFLADNYNEGDEDLASLGIAGKEGRKVTDYQSREFKKDSPKNFDQAYYDKYDKLKKLDAPPERPQSTSKNRLKKNGKKKWSAKKKVITIVIIVLLIILLLAGAAVALIYNYISKINIVKSPDTSIVSSIVDDDKTDEPDSPKKDIDELNEKVKNNMENKSEPLMYDENVMNVLVIGTDSRGSERGRSDSMILVSLNKNTNKIIMTSFLRDIYLHIPQVDEYTRLNHAYAYGGAELLMDTIEENFRIKIDKYVMVNFSSFVDVVDSVGGVDINVTEDEVQYVNSYLSEINMLRGDPTGSDKISSAGLYTLNGKQALAYSRIRYVGTDFGRTERQRTVMNKVLNKAKAMSLFEINDLLNVLLPKLTTNLTESEIFSLVLDVFEYLDFDTISQAIPQNNDFSYLTIRGMSVLGIDFDSSIDYLKKTIYNK